MTELREPPLIYNARELTPKLKEMAGINESVADLIEAQREADIKWMKEHCYIKAEERELRGIPACSFEKYSQDEVIDKCKLTQRIMLKEVDGIAYRASKEFKD